MLSNWRQKFRDLDQLPAHASRQDKAQRGRDFEKVLTAMFDEAGLQARLQYRPQGEEVDGSIWLDGRTILIEAKWTEQPHPASSIYQFKGKVDGKLVGTLGLFISINGFSKDAVDALVLGKELNVILADGVDMRALADNHISIVELLHRKLRAAGDEGNVNWTYEATAASGGVNQPEQPRRIVVVEGRNDARYLEAVRRVLGVQTPVAFIPAGGALNVPRQVRALLQEPEVASIAAIVDGDVDPYLLDKMQVELHALSKDIGVPVEFVVAEPDMETVLGLPSKRSMPRDQARSRDAYLLELLSEKELKDRAETDDSFRSILRVIS